MMNTRIFEEKDKTVVTEEQCLDWLVLKVAATLVKLLENDEAIYYPSFILSFVSF